MFYCLDGNTGLVEWTYYIGDPIRSSASLGPDPEEKEEYLVYFGGGDGIVYALEPNGIMRWSYNTLLKASNTDYPNINASIALGHHGLVVASSTGDVIWIPYNYYLRANAEGINKTREGLTQKEGFFWHYVNPGGSLKKDPLEDETYEIDPTSILSLRLIQYDKQGHLPVNFAPKSVKIEIYPYINHTWELQSDMSTLHIIPNIILKPDTEYLISISGKYSNRRGKKKTIQSELRFKTRIPPQMASLLSSPKKTFKIEYMAVPQPNIVPSLDQIGLASLTIPFSIIDSDPEEKTFTAFAVQKFGEVGVPQKRISLYAFTGKVEDDYFLMECRNCEFEITSFSIPLDRFRVAGFFRTDGSVRPGGSLLIQKNWGGQLFNLMRDLSKDSPISIRMLMDHLKMGGISQFLKAGKDFFPALIRQLVRGTWQSWGLLNHKNKLTGVGTFRLAPYESEEEAVKSRVEMNKFEYTEEQPAIVAEVTLKEKFRQWETVLSIIVMDLKKHIVVPMKYHTAIKYESLGPYRKRITLPLPNFLDREAKKYKAHLLAEIYSLTSIEL